MPRGRQGINEEVSAMYGWENPGLPPGCVPSD